MNFMNCDLIKTDSIFKFYTGKRQHPMGYIPVRVNYGRSNAVLDLYVVRGEGPPLIGRDWF